MDKYDVQRAFEKALKKEREHEEYVAAGEPKSRDFFVLILGYFSAFSISLVFSSLLVFFVVAAANHIIYMRFRYAAAVLVPIQYTYAFIYYMGHTSGIELSFFDYLNLFIENWYLWLPMIAIGLLAAYRSD